MTSGVSHELTALFESLHAGADAHSVRLSALSDLNREGADFVRRNWAGVPPETRDQLMEVLVEAAAGNVGLHFGRLALTVLEDVRAAVRRGALELLAEDTDRRTADRVRRVLEEDADESVRATAAESLRYPVWLYSIEDFDEQAGRKLVASLFRAADDPEEAVNVRASAIETLGFVAHEPPIERVIMDAYYHDDSRLRLAALRAMADGGYEKWFEYLVEQTRSDDPDFRVVAAAGLGELGEEEGLDHLEALLDDADPDVVESALMAIGKVGGEDALRLLEEFQESASEEWSEVIEEAIAEAVLQGELRELAEQVLSGEDDDDIDEDEDDFDEEFEGRGDDDLDDDLGDDDDFDGDGAAKQPIDIFRRPGRR